MPDVGRTVGKAVAANFTRGVADGAGPTFKDIGREIGKRASTDFASTRFPAAGGGGGGGFDPISERERYLRLKMLEKYVASFDKPVEERKRETPLDQMVQMMQKLGYPQDQIMEKMREMAEQPGMTEYLMGGKSLPFQFLLGKGARQEGGIDPSMLMMLNFMSNMFNQRIDEDRRGSRVPDMTEMARALNPPSAQQGASIETILTLQREASDEREKRYQDRIENDRRYYESQINALSNRPGELEMFMQQKERFESLFPQPQNPGGPRPLTGEEIELKKWERERSLEEIRMKHAADKEEREAKLSEQKIGGLTKMMGNLAYMIGRGVADSFTETKKEGPKTEDDGIFGPASGMKDVPEDVLPTEPSMPSDEEENPVSAKVNEILKRAHASSGRTGSPVAAPFVPTSARPNTDGSARERLRTTRIRRGSGGFV